MKAKIYSSSTQDLKKWHRYFEKIENKGIYHHPEYIKFLEKYYYRDSKAELFLFEDGDSFVYYPYFKRPLNFLFLKAEKKFPGEYYDTVSSWYYGGPLINRSFAGQSAFIKNFFSNFEKYCRESNVVASFDRLDPIVGNHTVFGGKEGLAENRPIVYTDLEKEEINLWRQLKGSVRRNIKRAFASGLRITVNQNADKIKCFWQIYTNEMIRKKASGRLKFPYIFFQELFEVLGKNIILLLAEFEKEIIGGFIIAHDNLNAHHFLSASIPEFWNQRVNDLLFYSAILQAKKIGCKKFDFQGGRKGVFEFKEKFSRDKTPFYTYSMVHQRKIYDYLVRAAIDREKITENNKNYFPGYRTDMQKGCNGSKI